VAIDFDTIRRMLGAYQDDDERRVVIHLTNGETITPVHVHRVNNCSLEIEEPGSVTVVPLDQIAIIRFVATFELEVDES